MSEIRVLLNSTSFLVSYPRVGTTGEFLRKQPVSCTVRIGTPAVPLPTVEASATADTLEGATAADAVEGDTALELGGTIEVDESASTDIVDTGTFVVDTFFLDIVSATLVEGNEYDVTGTVNVVDNDGNAPPHAGCNGTITAHVHAINGALVVTGAVVTLNQTNLGGHAAFSLAFASTGLSLRLQLTCTQAFVRIQGTRSIAAVPTTALVTLLAGRRYLLSADELLDEITVRFATATRAVLREPLVEDVAEGTSILGFACSKALTSAQTAQAGRAQAIWTATFEDGTTATWSQLFRIVRRLVVSTLTPTSLIEAYDVILTLRDRKDPNLEGLILAAWEHQVVPALEDAELDPENILSVEALEPLHAIGCLRQIVEGHPSVSDAFVARVDAQWQKRLNGVLSQKDWYDAPQDTDPAPPPAAPPMVRNGIRLVR